MKRIYHTWDKWECYRAGFYEPVARKFWATKEQCEIEYAKLLRNQAEFQAALQRVINEWPKSCEHYLSNPSMNRIAWLGQAALCIARGIPSGFRNGFNRLSEKEQERANQTALDALNQWLAKQGEPAVTLEEAGIGAKADIY